VAAGAADGFAIGLGANHLLGWRFNTQLFAASEQESGKRENEGYK
jgi:hypothetical protein